MPERVPPDAPPEPCRGRNGGGQLEKGGGAKGPQKSGCRLGPTEARRSRRAGLEAPEQLPPLPTTPGGASWGGSAKPGKQVTSLLPCSRATAGAQLSWGAAGGSSWPLARNSAREDRGARCQQHMPQGLGVLLGHLSSKPSLAWGGGGPTALAGSGGVAQLMAAGPSVEPGCPLPPLENLSSAPPRELHCS